MNFNPRGEKNSVFPMPDTTSDPEAYPPAGIEQYIRCLSSKVAPQTLPFHPFREASPG